jgi:hypothetical protein
MNARHRIRLAGPWKTEVHHSSSHHELAGKHLKAALDGIGEPLGHPFYGKLTLRRNFNLPTGLDEHSVVWLCVEGLPLRAPCEIILNRQPLDRTGGEEAIGRVTKFGVTDNLETFNRVEIALTCDHEFTPVQLDENFNKVMVQTSVWLEIE